MTELQNELTDFTTLGVDSKPVTDAQDVVEKLEALIKTATSEMLKLRPGGKDYDAKLSELQNRTNAYKAQLDGARADLAKAIDDLKQAVITKAGDYQDVDYHALRELDEAIVHALLEVRDLIISRSIATEEFDAKHAILERYNNELQAGIGLRTSRTPWLRAYPTPWSNALREYVNRFMALAGSSMDSPGDGDALEWFGRRR